MEFDDRCLSSLINDNLYESRVLKVCVIQVLIPIVRIISSCSALLLRSIWSRRVSLCRTCYRPALRNWTMETITARVRFNHLKLATSFPDDYTSPRDQDQHTCHPCVCFFQTLGQPECLPPQGLVTSVPSRTSKTWRTFIARTYPVMTCLVRALALGPGRQYL